MATKKADTESKKETSEKVVSLKDAAAKKEATAKPTATQKTAKKPAAKSKPKATKKAAPKKAAPKPSTAKKVKAVKSKSKSATKKSAASKSVKKAATKSTTKKQSTKTMKPKTVGSAGTAKASPQMTDMINTIKTMETIMPTTTSFKFDELAQEAANAGRENVEAFIKSGTIFAKGFENWVKTASTISQSAAEKQAEYAKEIMSIKTLDEAAQAQSKIAQANFEEFVSNMTKLSEMGTKLLNDTAEPLNAQITKTMKKASKAA